MKSIEIMKQCYHFVWSAKQIKKTRTHKFQKLVTEK